MQTIENESGVLIPDAQSAPGRTESVGRRALLASAAGALAGVSLSAIARPGVARAADGDPVLLGSNSNQSTNVTRINSPYGYVEILPPGAAMFVRTEDQAFALTASVGNGDPDGVAVNGGSAGLDNQVGVLGNSQPAGTGVKGETQTGTGVHALASSPSGTALQVSGRAVFSGSGTATVQAGARTATVTGQTLTSLSLILATIQGAGARGLYILGVKPNAGDGSFRIRLSRAATKDTTVAWFIVN